jgi:hypothetical protein
MLDSADNNDRPRAATYAEIEEDRARAATYAEISDRTRAEPPAHAGNGGLVLDFGQEFSAVRVEGFVSVAGLEALLSFVQYHASRVSLY